MRCVHVVPFHTHVSAPMKPFDNLWENVRNNNFILPLLSITARKTDFLAPISTAIQMYAGKSPSSNFPDLTLVDPGLRNGRVQSYFAGTQQRLTDNLTLEVNGLGSYGRNLITTDIVNRPFSTASGRYNPKLPDIAYRAGEGFSNYNALAAVLRYRTNRGMVQGTYTWSHTIDNQSDALTGDFFNLNFTGIQTSGDSSGRLKWSSLPASANISAVYSLRPEAGATVSVTIRSFTIGPRPPPCGMMVR